MKSKPPLLCRTAALLLAAAALPSTALLAQEAQPPADPPAAETPAPAPTPAPAEPVAETPAPAPAPETAVPAPAVTRTTTVRRAAPAPRATATRTVRTAPAPVAAPAATAPLPAPAAALPPPPAELVPPAASPEVLPETPAAVAPAPQPEAARNPSVLPWVLGGFLLLGLAAFFLLRRRRTAVVDHHDTYREPVSEAPVYVEEAPPVAVAAVPAAAAMAAAPAGEPRIELSMRPIRAGMGEDDARVEFELTLDNLGNADAQDVRVSTWMLAAGATDMERSLIEPRDSADTPPATIAAGEARTVEAAVAMPRGEVQGDSILPVVVADARYRGPDGSECRASASFAVGVAIEGELAHFDTQNPSGLHEGVEAREIR